MIEMLPADAESIDKGLAAFELTAPILCREPGHLKRMVDEGFIEVSTLAVDGKPAYLVGWHQTPDGGFWFDLVQRIGPAVPNATIAAVVEAMARKRKAPYLRWLTYRAGIARWAQQEGFTPEAIILTKTLS